MGKIIAIATLRGGVGKTTTTFNMAYALSEMGMKILTVDFDSLSSLTFCYEEENIRAFDHISSSDYLAESQEIWRERYDYILFDTAPTLDELTVNALAMVDEVIIPVVPALLEIMGLGDFEHLINKVKREMNPKLEIGGILFTMWEGEKNPRKADSEDVKRCFREEVRVFETKIPKVKNHTHCGEIIEEYRKFAKEYIYVEKNN